ncbi:hypothetical protein KEM56_007059 [Ascosphaera pollenicola]|nr:hypothetical protein KEM56_007059 [Ascosphaera pollenicola]
MDNWNRRPSLLAYGRQQSSRSQRGSAGSQGTGSGSRPGEAYSTMDYASVVRGSPATTPMEEATTPGSAAYSSPGSPAASPATTATYFNRPTGPATFRRPSYQNAHTQQQFHQSHQQQYPPQRSYPAQSPGAQPPSSLRSHTGSSFMTRSSTSLGQVMAARRPSSTAIDTGNLSGTNLNNNSHNIGNVPHQPTLSSTPRSELTEDIQAKMKAFSLSRRPGGGIRNVPGSVQKLGAPQYSPTNPRAGGPVPAGAGAGINGGIPPARSGPSSAAGMGVTAGIPMNGRLPPSKTTNTNMATGAAAVKGQPRPPLGRGPMSGAGAGAGPSAASSMRGPPKMPFAGGAPGNRGPTMPAGGGLAAKRGIGFKLSDAGGGVNGAAGGGSSPVPGAGGGGPGAAGGGLQRKNKPMSLSGMGGGNPAVAGGARQNHPGALNGVHGNAGQGPAVDNAFSMYSEVVDTRRGTLNFKNKAIIHGGGIDFSSGRSFSISLDEVEMLDELGKGNYGTVYKVRHARPKLRRPGQGIRGTSSSTNSSAGASSSSGTPTQTPPALSEEEEKAMMKELHEKKLHLSNVVMAMKEIRLELDESKFTSIVMELDVLHRCVSPFIIDFYGAFFQEGAVYICVEYMDGGSVEKLYDEGVPENILRKITLSTVMGLKSLKDEHNIIHRDVKPTNILVNTRGQIKICDFGVSGNLVASIAKTNIGCQSYMAPERIAGGSALAGGGKGTYSVQSDVWSLGLTVIECAMGRYPYPPETSTNIFSQLSAIVSGDPPELPDTYSPEARDFVKSCLNKNADLRPTYNMMLRHPWLSVLLQPPSAPPSSSTTSTPSEGATTWPLADLRRRSSTSNAAGSQPPSSNKSSAPSSQYNTPSPSDDGLTPTTPPNAGEDRASTPSIFQVTSSNSSTHSANTNTTTGSPKQVSIPKQIKPETASPPTPPTIDTADEEVASWVQGALERRAAAKSGNAQSPSSTTFLPNGTPVLNSSDCQGGMTAESAIAAAKMSHAAHARVSQAARAKMVSRPALHAVALDQVPGTTGKGGDMNYEGLGGIF